MAEPTDFTSSRPSTANTYVYYNMHGPWVLNVVLTPPSPTCSSSSATSTLSLQQFAISTPPNHHLQPLFMTPTKSRPISPRPSTGSEKSTLAGSILSLSGALAVALTKASRSFTTFTCSRQTPATLLAKFTSSRAPASLSYSSQARITSRSARTARRTPLANTSASSPSRSPPPSRRTALSGT